MVEVLIFCVREDEWLLQKIAKGVIMLERKGRMRAWSILDVRPGEIREVEIMVHLEAAHLILILISPDFVASPYSCGKEMERCLQRRQEGARVIPILVRSALWEDTPFGQLKALPTNGKPIKNHPDKSDAALGVAQEIYKIVEEIAEKFKSSPPLDRESSYAFLPPGTLQSSRNAEVEDLPRSQVYDRLSEAMDQISRNMQFVDSEEDLEKFVRQLKNTSSEVVGRLDEKVEVTIEFLVRFRKKWRSE